MSYKFHSLILAFKQWPCGSVGYVIFFILGT